MPFSQFQPIEYVLNSLGNFHNMVQHQLCTAIQQKLYLFLNQVLPVDTSKKRMSHDFADILLATT